MARFGISICLFIFLLATSPVTAQKYGHLNFGNLLELMPDREKADEELKAFRVPLQEEYDAKVKKYKEMENALVKGINGGEYSRKQIEQKQVELQQKQQEIANYENSILQQLEKKRQDLLKPLIEKIDDAIAEVAKENGYIMIFDTSIVNGVLYAQDSDDIMPLVKAKLGLE